MRCYTDPRNIARSHANKEARYLIGSSRRDDMKDNALYPGSAHIALRWLDMFADRKRFFFDAPSPHALTAREVADNRRAA